MYVCTYVCMYVRTYVSHIGVPCNFLDPTRDRSLKNFDLFLRPWVSQNSVRNEGGAFFQNPQGTAIAIRNRGSPFGGNVSLFVQPDCSSWRGFTPSLPPPARVEVGKWWGQCVATPLVRPRSCYVGPSWSYLGAS